MFNFFQCLCAIRLNPTLNSLQEALLSTAFLTAVSRDFAHQWRFKLPRAYQESLKIILSTTHLCVAMLLHPRLLQKQAKVPYHFCIMPFAVMISHNLVVFWLILMQLMAFSAYTLKVEFSESRL